MTANGRRIASTTLVCIDTDNPVLARAAVERSMRLCRFDRALCLSDTDWAPPGAEWVPIERIAGFAAYNRLVLKELGPLIDTDHLLMIQYDGFVLDPARWDDGFLDYDYIGAPWRGHGQYSVGNGGFSLRSRRLLEALRDPLIVPGAVNEDAVICRDHRDHLESAHGIRFADPATALRFAYETDDRPDGGSFGFHGVINAALVYHDEDPAFFIDNLSGHTIANPRIVVMLFWYLSRQFLGEAQRLLRRIEAAQSPDQLAAAFRAVGLTPDDLAQVRTLLAAHA
jgi:hypothetical protein